MEVVYSHYATKREEQQAYDDIFYIVRIPVTDDGLPTEQVMTADMTEREI